MKKQNPYIRVLLITIALSYLLVFSLYSEDLKDKPDSIRYVMGVTVDDSTLEELPGTNIKEFKLYMTDQNSAIVWKYKNYFYVYILDDSNHQLKAIKIFAQLQKNGISTFVAKGQGKKIRFNEYRKVIAIHITADKL